MRTVILAAAVATAAALTTRSGKPPHIILVVQDDLGWADTGAMLGKDWPAAEYTQNITALAAEGLKLTRMHSHWHCSPTRRSVLTGRTPIHHGEQLSGVQTDDVDLRMTLLPNKLRQAGYTSYATGKGHTGYKSMHHLWVNNGFDHYVGYLTGSQSYHASDRWEDDHPVHDDSQFQNPPPGCGNSTEVGGSGASCDPSTIQPDTEMPCSSGIPKFADARSATDCCAQCSGLDWCTHWVFAPSDSAHPPCHLKAGDVPASCIVHKAGSTSGITRKPKPGPSPPPLGPASCATEYGTDLYGSVAVQAIEGHNASSPMFLYLAFQDQHVPYMPPPWSPYPDDVYKSMMWAGDVQFGRVVSAIKAKGMWEDTILIYVSDNGGVEDGLNYPLRGEKHSNWDGGFRVAAFIAGGALPADLRGGQSNVVSHVADLYATICSLAGVDPADGPAVPPLPVDPSQPGKDIYGNDSYPALDGVDLWPALTSGASNQSVAAHDYLVLSREVIRHGRYKLLVAQPLFKTQNNGWKQPNGTWLEPANLTAWPCAKQDLSPQESFLPGVPGQRPCLFDVEADPGEHHDIAASYPGLVNDLWARLNATVLTFRDCSGWMGPVPGPDGSCSPPELLGHCDAECANAHWHAVYNGAPGDEGPVCAVPACNGTSSG